MRDDRSALMRDEIRRILNCPSLDFFYSADFVVREKLQEAIKEKLGSGSFAYSVSHSKVLGGAAFAADGVGQVGFDLEQTNRVHNEVALRVSDPDQFRKAPSAAALFVSKEAAFKALRGPRQPAILSEVEILEWNTHDFSPPLYNFTARLKSQQIQWFGVCFEDGENTVGISLFPHSS